MRCKGERGVSLIEVLVAAAILLIGLVPMIRVFLYELQVANRANKMIIATNLARDMSEEIRAQYFSEEFANYTSRAYWQVWPNITTVAQSFGREGSGETNTQAYTTANKGRIRVFDDVDDYDAWCRGPQCGDGSILETFDGFRYDGTQGYPDYQRYTRRVRIRNIFPLNYDSLQKTLPGSIGTLDISRYDFDNWSALRLDAAGNDATGKSPLKIIEVTVAFDALGSDLADQEVQDVGFVVMPMSPPAGLE